MRRLSLLSSLPAALVALTLGSAAAASPALVTRTGAFHAPGVAVVSRVSEPVLENASRTVLSEQIETSRGLGFGPARFTTLASGDRVVKLPQVHKGLFVAHRGAAVVWNGDGARAVSARLEADLPDDVTPAITAAAAAAVSEARTGLPVSDDRVALALWPTPDGVRLVWAMSAAPIPGVPYEPVTVVDAKTGDIIYHYNAIVDLDLSKVFPTNPVKSPDVVQVTLPVGAGKAVLDNDLVQSFNCIDNKTVKNVSFMGFSIQVHACDLVQTAMPDANGDYFIAPGDDKAPEDQFSEVSMFHHVNRAYDMFRGWNKDLNVNNGPIPTVSNLRIPQGFDTFDLNKIKDPNLPLAPFQNAFFAPANPIFSAVFGLDGGAMWFGQGPLKDYSYDGDVVYHEFTHSVVNVTLKLVGNPHMDEFGTSYSPGAMNEGLADYFSSALAGDPDVGEYATQDIAPGSKAIRSLTNPDACPGDIGGEVHQDATMFSGSLWDARAALEASDQLKFDGAVFAAMNASPTGDLAYEDLAKLIVDQVKTNVGDAAAKSLTDAFTKRGLLPKCSRVLEYTGASLSGPAALKNLWWGPGTQTTGVTESKGKWTPGVVQVHDKLPDGTTKLDMQITSVAVGGGGLGMGGTPFTPKFLVRFGKDPIQFKYKPLATSADVVVVDATKNGSAYNASVDVPAGTAELYVMVVSTGQSDGAYTKMVLTPSSAPVMTGSGGSGGAGGTGGSGGGVAPGGAGGTGGTGGAGGDSTVTSGCGCSLPGSGAPEGAALAALAALGLAAQRRRRRA
jgi:MYXO-CTERM domain-containing protein